MAAWHRSQPGPIFTNSRNAAGSPYLLIPSRATSFLGGTSLQRAGLAVNGIHADQKVKGQLNEGSEAGAQWKPAANAASFHLRAEPPGETNRQVTQDRQLAVRQVLEAQIQIMEQQLQVFQRGREGRKSNDSDDRGTRRLIESLFACGRSPTTSRSFPMEDLDPKKSFLGAWIRLSFSDSDQLQLPAGIWRKDHIPAVIRQVADNECPQLLHRCTTPRGVGDGHHSESPSLSSSKLLPERTD